jgi:spore germination cell wall hydrolase CwlJ-like protein
MITVESTPLPDSRLPFHMQATPVLLAMCIFGEARGEIPEAQYAVGCVVRNRVENGRYGTGWTWVILKPYQFSSFNADDPNRAKLMEPKKHEPPEVWWRCYVAADMVMRHFDGDPTHGAVFYFSGPLTEPPAAWGPVIETAVIGHLHFCRPA